MKTGDDLASTWMGEKNPAGGRQVEVRGAFLNHLTEAGSILGSQGQPNGQRRASHLVYAVRHSTQILPLTGINGTAPPILPSKRHGSFDLIH